MVAPEYINVPEILDHKPAYDSMTLRDWLEERVRENPEYFIENRQQATYEAVKNFRIHQRRIEMVRGGEKQRNYRVGVSREALVKHSSDWFDDEVKKMTEDYIIHEEKVAIGEEQKIVDEEIEVSKVVPIEKVEVTPVEEEIKISEQPIIRPSIRSILRKAAGELGYSRYEPEQTTTIMTFGNSPLDRGRHTYNNERMSWRQFTAQNISGHSVDGVKSKYYREKEKVLVL